MEYPIAVVQARAARRRDLERQVAELQALNAELVEACRDALAWMRYAGGMDMGDETSERIGSAIANATKENAS